MPSLRARSPRARRRRRCRLGAVGVVTASAALALGAGVPYWIGHAHAGRYPVAASVLADARRSLDRLPVRPPASNAGYSRDAFGPAWADVDHNGCDTRNDVLRRDMTDVTFEPGTRDCVVASGTLAEPYGGRTIHFVRGPGSTAVQIDHMVALDDAWRTGAQGLTADQREQLANDPANLLAVDGPLNQDKSASDASGWLPPNRGFRCVYVVRQIRVKTAYGLWVTSAEKTAMAKALRSCVTVAATS
jgi:hypothetical protein